MNQIKISKQKFKFPEMRVKVLFKNKIPPEQLIQVKSHLDIFYVLNQIFDRSALNIKEEAIMICLNRSQKIIGFYKVSSGSITSCSFDARIVFSVALNCLATSIIIAHNHPSGSVFPSENDLKVTKKIKDAGAMLDIQLMDHIIFSNEGFFSIEFNTCFNNKEIEKLTLSVNQYNLYDCSKDGLISFKQKSLKKASQIFN